MILSEGFNITIIVRQLEPWGLLVFLNLLVYLLPPQLIITRQGLLFKPDSKFKHLVDCTSCQFKQQSNKMATPTEALKPPNFNCKILQFYDYWEYQCQNFQVISDKRHITLKSLCLHWMAKNKTKQKTIKILCTIKVNRYKYKYYSNQTS